MFVAIPQLQYRHDSHILTEDSYHSYMTKHSRGESKISHSKINMYLINFLFFKVVIGRLANNVLKITCDALNQCVQIKSSDSSSM